MSRPRAPFITSLLAALLAAILERLVRPAFKAIFDVTVQDWWKETASPFLQRHFGAGSIAMVEAIGPFWAGVACAFALMFVVEMFFAWRRSRAGLSGQVAKSEADQSYTDTRLRLRLDPSGTGRLIQEAQTNIHWLQQSIVHAEGKDEGGNHKGPLFHAMPSQSLLNAQFHMRGRS